MQERSWRQPKPTGKRDGSLNRLCSCRDNSQCCCLDSCLGLRCLMFARSFAISSHTTALVDPSFTATASKRSRKQRIRPRASDITEHARNGFPGRLYRVNLVLCPNLLEAKELQDNLVPSGFSPAARECCGRHPPEGPHAKWKSLV